MTKKGAAVEIPARTLDWLLEPGDPSVRFFTLRDILGERPASAKLAQARREIMARGPVARILSRQKAGGYWGEPEDFYARSKYKGTVWNLILLATLGADGRDPRVRRACDFVLEYSQDRASGGFSYAGTARNGGTPSGVVPCLTGNMLWSLVRLGRLGDPGVRRGLDWITRYLRCDDGGTRAPREQPYLRYEMCWGRHTCLDGVVKPLKALAEVPAVRRSPAMKRTIDRAAEFLLIHRLYQRSHAPGRPAKLKWLKLAFPLMWDTDALEMLDILAGLGCRDPRLRDAQDLVLSKRDREGRWPLEETYTGRFLVGFGRKGAPSKWVTLRALKALGMLDRNPVL